MCFTLKHKDAIENNEMLNDEQHIQVAHYEETITTSRRPPINIALPK